MLNRRDAIGASLAAATAAATATTATAAGAKATAGPPPDEPREARGFGFTPLADANPLEAKITVFTTVSPDVDASIRFYRDVIGMTLAEDGTLPGDVSSGPGVGQRGRRHAVLTGPGKSAAVRVLEAPPNARPNRPRPGSSPRDPGLMVMEGGARDPAESYHRLASANTPMITPPRYYWYRNITWGRDIDVMSYSPFGPGGEQMFITANIRGDRPAWPHPGVHSGFNNAAITTLDQRPADAFYEQALGIKRTSQMDSYQKNCNQLIGAPDDAYYLWGNVGSGVSIEVWEYKALTGTTYPTSLDRTGLAMLTMRVNDLAKCRAMCKAAGIAPVGEGALPLPGVATRDGFYLRGAVGELIEVVSA
jgi:catechol 2,3-dioxygenase-like lactoylglutathione lyase family enzyme